MSRRNTARGSSLSIVLLSALTGFGCGPRPEPRAPAPAEADLQHSRQMEEELARSGQRILALEAEVAGLQKELRDAQEVARQANAARSEASAELAAYAADIPGAGALFTAIETSMGTFHCELFPDRAPNTVANFVGLATGKKPWLENGKERRGRPFYDGLIFHRVIPGFMIQGGDPLGNGTGGPGFHFANETANTIGHVPGALAMANAGPDTNGSQFYITAAAQPQLDRGFTVFGHCQEPELVAKIAEVPRDGRDKPITPVTIKSVTFSRQRR